MIFFISFATLVATMLGGLFALRFSDKLHLVLGFSAGAVIGVAFFDLLPEAISIAGQYYSISFILLCTAIGFLGYMLLDRSTSLSVHHEDHCENESHQHARGRVGAGSLSAHSFLDGLAIGLAFQVSAAIGAVVAIAVLVHDYSDGINTVSLVLKNGGTRAEAFKWLLLDAVAPVLGVLSTLLFTVPERYLGLILAVFAGFFLYIGGSDLLPESHHRHPTYWTSLMTVLGAAVLYVAIHFAA